MEIRSITKHLSCREQLQFFVNAPETMSHKICSCKPGLVIILICKTTVWSPYPRHAASKRYFLIHFPSGYFSSLI